MVERAAVAAGEFYPADPATLATAVDGLLAEVPAVSARGFLVPHGPYHLSGRTAAHAYRGLTGVDRVVLVGPAHFVLFRGCQVSGARSWSTPLGEVPVDQAVVRELAQRGLATVDDRAHRPEHALEVQLPFLQRALGTFSVVPLAVDVSDVDSVARVLLAATEGAPDRTVVIASSDLSHNLDAATAAERDGATLAAIGALDHRSVAVRDACGVYAVRGLLGWARAVGLSPRVLHRSYSGTGHATVGFTQ